MQMSLEGAPSPLAVAIYRLEVSRTKKFLDGMGAKETLVLIV